MKTILIVIGILTALVLAPFAVADKGSSMKMHACMSCKIASKTKENCPKCKGKMTTVKGKMVYVCNHCGTSSSKPGDCKMCHKKMEQEFCTFSCDACHTSSDKAGKCSKCQKDMKKTMLKM